MGVYKRGNLYWLSYVGADGRQVRESSGVTSKREAENMLVSRKKDVLDGKQPEKNVASSATINDLSRDYLDWCKKQRAYKSKGVLVNKIVERFNLLRLKKFNTMLTEQYQSELIVSGKSTATVNRYLAVLKHMFTKAVDWNMAPASACSAVHKVKMLKENNKRTRYLEQAEINRLVACSGGILRSIIVTAILTGMRRGEILSLKWDNVDFSNRTIWLDGDNTKTGDGRELPMNDRLYAELMHIIRWTSTNYVFVNPDTGSRFVDIKKGFSNSCRAAGIKDFNFHDLRHTFASQLVMAGIPIATVSRLLGHKSLAMTMRYAHTSAEHKAQAVAAMDRLMGGLA